MHLTFALFFLLSFSSVSSSIVVYEGKVTNSVKKHRERERKGTLLSKSAKYQTAIVVSSFLPAFGIIRKRKKKKKKEGENTTHCGFSCVDEHESQKVQGGGEGVGFTSTIVFDVVLLLHNFEQLSCQHDRCLAAIFGCSKTKWKNQQKKKTTITTIVPLPYSSALSTFFPFT